MGRYLSHRHIDNIDWYAFHTLLAVTQVHLCLVLGLVDGFKVFRFVGSQDLRLFAQHSDGPGAAVAQLKLLAQPAGGLSRCNPAQRARSVWPLLAATSDGSSPSFPRSVVKLWSVAQARWVHVLRLPGPVHYIRAR